MMVAKPCPFCASTRLGYNCHQSGRRYFETNKALIPVQRTVRGPRHVNVKCNDCRAKGPSAGTLALAITLWDRAGPEPIETPQSQGVVEKGA